MRVVRPAIHRIHQLVSRLEAGPSQNLPLPPTPTRPLPFLPRGLEPQLHTRGLMRGALLAGVEGPAEALPANATCPVSGHHHHRLGPGDISILCIHLTASVAVGLLVGFCQRRQQRGARSRALDELSDSPPHAASLNSAPNSSSGDVGEDAPLLGGVLGAGF